MVNKHHCWASLSEIVIIKTFVNVDKTLHRRVLQHCVQFMYLTNIVTAMTDPLIKRREKDYYYMAQIWTKFIPLASAGPKPRVSE